MTSSEEVGSIAHEAFKLFRAVSGGPDGAAAADVDGSATDQHVCSTSWCPVCQVVGFVRNNPEALDAVTHSATAFVRSLRDLVDVALAPQENT